MYDLLAEITFYIFLSQVVATWELLMNHLTINDFDISGGSYVI